MCPVRWSPSYWMRLNSTRPPKAHGEEFTQPLLPRENKKMPRWFSSDLVSLSNIIRRNWFRDDETFPLIGCWRCNVLWKMVAWLEASVFCFFLTQEQHRESNMAPSMMIFVLVELSESSLQLRFRQVSLYCTCPSWVFVWKRVSGNVSIAKYPYSVYFYCSALFYIHYIKLQQWRKYRFSFFLCGVAVRQPGW